MSEGPLLALVDYGAGNLRSVEFALDRLGVAHRRVAEPGGLGGADGIVLPGVGAAESAMEELRRRGLSAALAGTELPLLGVCLGMQLLTEISDEGERPVPCLGRVPGRTRRFAEGVRLPQIGWNEVQLSADPLFEGLDRKSWFYFLHGHRAECPERWVIARARYGEVFPAALRRGTVAGVQFHPEKSGAAGLRVLANFARSCRRDRGAAAGAHAGSGEGDDGAPAGKPEGPKEGPPC